MAVRSTTAAVLTAYGEPLSLREVEVPELVPGSLVVEVEAATICGTDVHIADGGLSAAAALPAVLGHEYVGRVAALLDRPQDANGERLTVGDRVVFAYPWCGSCYWCTIAGLPTKCTMNRMYGWGPCDTWPFATGGFAQHMFVWPQSQVLRVDPDLDPYVVASTTCALRTVMHAYERLGAIRDVQFEDTVVVLGSGPVGLYATAVAKARGARRVITIGMPTDRLRTALSWGADHVLDISTSTADERAAAVRDLTAGRGAEIALDCAGPVQVFADAMVLVRDGGVVVEVGANGAGDVGVRPPAFNLRMISVTGSVSGSIRHYHRALSFVERFRSSIDFGELVSPPRPLAQVNEALAAARTQAEIKPSLAPGM